MFTPIYNAGKLFKQYLLAPNHPSKVRIQNQIGKKIFSKGIDLKNENGVQFTLDANDWITRILIKEGGYEQGSTALSKKILLNGGLFIDVGANFGLFTCMAAYNNPKVKVIAVEPNYKVLQRLLYNIDQNGLNKNVKVMNTAVSTKFQLLTIDQPAADNMGTTVTRPGTNGLLSVACCPLDFICAENGIESVDLLKIDIEGKEFEILENFAFKKYEIKNIILEFNQENNIGFKEMHSFFMSKGYKMFSITGDELHDDKQGIPENNIWCVKQYVK